MEPLHELGFTLLQRNTIILCWFYFVLAYVTMSFVTSVGWSELLLGLAVSLIVLTAVPVTTWEGVGVVHKGWDEQSHLHTPEVRLWSRTPGICILPRIAPQVRGRGGPRSTKMSPRKTLLVRGGPQIRLVVPRSPKTPSPDPSPEPARAGDRDLPQTHGLATGLVSDQNPRRLPQIRARFRARALRAAALRGVGRAGAGGVLLFLKFFHVPVTFRRAVRHRADHAICLGGAGFAYGLGILPPFYPQPSTRLAGAHEESLHYPAPPCTTALLHYLTLNYPTFVGFVSSVGSYVGWGGGWV